MAEEPVADFEPTHDIRLVAIDLDGTLIRSDKRLSAVTVKAIQKCVEKGVKVVLATSRPPKSTAQIYKILGLDTVVINYNGALVHDPSAGAFPRRCQLNREVTLELIEAARKIIPNCMVRLDLEDRWITDREGLAPAADDPRTPKPDEVGALDDILTEDVTRLAIVAAPEQLTNIHNVLERKFGESYSLAHSNKKVLQMMHPDADKLTALLWVAKHYGIDREQVMAVGDAENDHGMIEWAGLGIAMGNADAETQGLADAVAPTNDKDGVAWALIKYILEAPGA